MHRIWIGLEPRLVVFAVHTAVAIIVMVIHLFAFNVIGYPQSIRQKYPQYKQTASVEAPASTATVAVASTR
ncbi:MAG: hypothetical protein MUF21_06460 [Gemmatimonadaceae bacterium]|jgi:cytoskeletal protein RodZ|nr:hypothetical protein [Gemmatimonadaceae bacterium]